MRRRRFGGGEHEVQCPSLTGWNRSGCAQRLLAAHRGAFERGRRRAAADDGAAMLEFTVLVVCVLVPVVYIVLSVMQVQAAAYAVTSAAREAGRALATGASVADGQRRAETAVQLALADQGFAAAGALSVECPACWRQGGQTRLTVSLRVDLPLLPDQWSRAAVPVTAVHVVSPDRYRVTK